jgi:outer membrane protein insertion porin family
VRIDRLFHEREPKVDLVVNVSEGLASSVGRIILRGNELTKDKVVLRSITTGLEPGRRFDRSGIDLTKRRLSESSLFSEAEVTVLGQPGDEFRDVLIEVTETNTGRLSFGAGISSDAGVVGAIDLVQRNFDIADWPDSFEEFASGRAFRGAGQYFHISLQPGNEFSRYSVAFREPYFLETDLFFDANFRYFNREREDWDEERLGGSLGLGQRFGDIWSARATVRFEEVGINDVEDDAPVDAFEVEGDNQITQLGASFTRSTVDSRLFPTQGSRLTVGVVRTGALGGDFDFTSVSASYNKFWTVEEDFLGRKTVLSFRVSGAYIIEDDEAPLFERFYAGGHRTFRGFEFRGVGPRGIRADTGRVGDDPVGGDWLFLAGVEYNWPVFQDVIRAVVFVDSGTVQEDFGFDEYRVSVGAGLRIKIPFLGQAPFAIDFAVPLVKQDDDETQIFSFDLDIPLR